MKTRRWIVVFALLAMILALLSWRLLRPAPAEAVTVWQDGSCIATLPLSADTELTVETADGGYNRIEIKNGAVAVTAADCPDGVCVARGASRGGMPIVCLPHKLVIRFEQKADVDGVTG